MGCPARTTRRALRGQSESPVRSNSGRSAQVVVGRAAGSTLMARACAGAATRESDNTARARREVPMAGTVSKGWASAMFAVRHGWRGLDEGGPGQNGGGEGAGLPDWRAVRLLQVDVHLAA